MDVNLALTYLAIVECGSFQAAAERLNVTQSTVSARIQTLEGELGQPLFLRGRHGAHMTDAGSRFRSYAEGMVRLWQRARQDIALPADLNYSIAVAGQISLWDRLLPQWLRWMRDRAPQIALRIEVDSPEQIIRQLVEGGLAIAVLYTSASRDGLIVEALFEDRLILVQGGGGAAGPGSPGYVYVDWGSEVSTAHAEAWPGREAPAIFVRIGALGLQHVLSNGGSGYFPERAVRGALADGRLSIVEGAPEFRRPVWMIRNADRDDAAIALACEGLREVVAEATA